MVKKISLLALVISLASCYSKKMTSESDEENLLIMDNSRNNLDWGGIYVGTLPCADCEGISVTLKLNSEDDTYHMTSSYMGKKSNSFVENDTLKWSRDGNKITLKNGQTFQVGENVLKLLTLDGEEIISEFIDNYALTKMVEPSKEAVGLAGMKFKIVKIDNKDYRNKESTEYFIDFLEEGRFTAKAGCNNMMGQYTFDGLNQISFGRVASTKKMCQFEHGEEALIQALSIVEKYEFSPDGNQLFLSINGSTILISLERKP